MSSDRVQTFGRKKSAVAVALIKQGKGNFRVNGLPVDSLTPEIMRVKGTAQFFLVFSSTFHVVELLEYE